MKTNPELLSENKELRLAISQAQTLLWRDGVKTGEGLTGMAKYVLERALGFCPRLPDPVPNEKKENTRYYEADPCALQPAGDGEEFLVPTWSDERSP